MMMPHEFISEGMILGPPTVVDPRACEEALRSLREMYWPEKKNIWQNSMKMKSMVDKIWSAAQTSGNQFGGSYDDVNLRNWLSWQDHQGT